MTTFLSFLGNGVLPKASIDKMRTGRRGSVVSKQTDNSLNNFADGLSDNRIGRVQKLRKDFQVISGVISGTTNDNLPKRPIYDFMQ